LFVLDGVGCFMSFKLLLLYASSSLVVLYTTLATAAVCVPQPHAYVRDIHKRNRHGSSNCPTEKADLCSNAWAGLCLLCSTMLTCCCNDNLLIGLGRAYKEAGARVHTCIVLRQYEHVLRGKHTCLYGPYAVDHGHRAALTWLLVLTQCLYLTHAACFANFIIDMFQFIVPSASAMERLVPDWQWNAVYDTHFVRDCYGSWNTTVSYLLFYVVQWSILQQQLLKAFR
jgi:hypothetical protein